VVTPTGMDSVLSELRRAAVSDLATVEFAGMEVVKLWEVYDLLLADERARAGSWWSVDALAAAVIEAMDGGSGRLATWLASIGRDGFSRERAVARLALDPSLDVVRLIALRVNDPVEQVRARVWKALQNRVGVGDARAVAPVLTRLSHRLRGAQAMVRYAFMFSESHGQPLWSVLLQHSDRDTRRWAFAAALRDGGIGPQECVNLLRTEKDQWVTARVVAEVVMSADPSAMTQLLESRHATARTTAIGSLPEAGLTDAAIVSALFDRAATVRAAARFRAAIRGIPAGPLYRRVWEEQHVWTTLGRWGERRSAGRCSRSRSCDAVSATLTRGFVRPGCRC
jgi:hypothetical protein